MYTNGKLFAWYDGSKWVWQGEEASDLGANSENDFAFAWRMLKNYLPLVHKKISADDITEAGKLEGGKNYMAFLKLLSYTLKEEDGLVPFVMDISLSADTEQLIDDMYEFLGEDFVTGVGKGAMWTTLSDLMDDLAANVESSTPESVAEVYRAYGFQQNGY